MEDKEKVNKCNSMFKSEVVLKCLLFSSFVH